MWWLVSLALAAPPAQEAPQPTIEVVPSITQGQFQITCPGRDGDRLFVDGWEAGVVPLVTELAEGAHEFRVDGAAGRLAVELYAKPEAGKTVTIVVAPAPVPAPIDPPAPTEAPPPTAEVPTSPPAPAPAP